LRRVRCALRREKSTNITPTPSRFPRRAWRASLRSRGALAGAIGAERARRCDRAERQSTPSEHSRFRAPQGCAAAALLARNVPHIQISIQSAAVRSAAVGLSAPPLSRPNVAGRGGAQFRFALWRQTHEVWDVASVGARWHWQRRRG